MNHPAIGVPSFQEDPKLGPIIFSNPHLFIGIQPVQKVTLPISPLALITFWAWLNLHLGAAVPVTSKYII